MFALIAGKQIFAEGIKNILESDLPELGIFSICAETSEEVGSIFVKIKRTMAEKPNLLFAPLYLSDNSNAFSLLKRLRTIDPEAIISLIIYGDFGKATMNHFLKKEGVNYSFSQLSEADLNPAKIRAIVREILEKTMPSWQFFESVHSR